MLQFSWLEGFCQGNFLGSEHLTSSSTKTAQMINFKLNTHVSNRLLHKIMPLFFLIKSHLFIFYCNNLKSFESIFRMKTVKSRFFKKYLKRRKSRARFCFSLGWLHISKKKLFKTAILLVQELIKQEKQVVFGPTLTLILLIFGERTNGKLYILRKVGLSKFKEIL